MNTPRPTPQQKFIVDLYPAARRIGRETGMSWELILAQAAQETGWGQKVLSGTNNIFNIKASPGWDGPTRTFNVWEIENGRKVWKDQPFRVYGSVEEALRDRVEFLRDNPRYGRAGLFNDGVKGDFESEARALQRAGYATDPEYAANLERVFNGRTMQAAIAYARANTRDEPTNNPSSPRANAGPTPAPREGARSSAAIYHEAHRHFIAPGNTFEYGRGDTQSRNNEGNRLTDRSRNEQDTDGDGLKGVDCSSFVWRALKNAGYDVPPNTPRDPFTTHDLFNGRTFTAFARQNFDVISARDASRANGSLQAGDIICFKKNGSSGQHVGIFSGYDARGVPQFIGSQVGHGPGAASAAPGSYWNGGDFEIVGALRARPEFQVRAPLHANDGQTNERAQPTPGRPAARPATPVADAVADADGKLAIGEKGPAVIRLQQRLADLGYRGADGRPLAADGDFGTNTRHALQQFQREHGLQGLGVAGPKTEVALDRAAHALMTHPSHPHHALYEKVLEKLHDAESAKGVRSGHHSERIAAALAVECLREGITRIDRVEINRDSTLVRAVQVSAVRDEPGLNRGTDGISVPQAAQQTLAESSEQIHQVAVNRLAQQREEQPARAMAAPAP